MDASAEPKPIPPTPLRLSPENIPHELKALRHWVVWRYEHRNGKWTKRPLRADDNGYASSTDSTTWSDYATALATYQKGGVDGIGFVLTSDIDFVFIDLDHCYNPQTKSYEPWATAIISHFNSYTEASPSGTGAHIFLKGKLPGGGHKKGNVEIYSSGRYLTVTGRVLRNGVRTIEPRQAEIDAFLAEHFPEPKIEKGTAANSNGHLSDHEIIEIGLRAKNGDKLKALLAGNCDGYASASEAELALCSLLAFYSQDKTQIDRIYRGSRLFRDKWDEKHGADTYGARTIDKAVSSTTETYSGRAEKAPEFDSAPREKNVRKETLTLQTWADFVATEHGSGPFTVEGIAPDSGLVAFHGRGKGGKTTFLIHCARSIAAGETFLERATVKKPVVYLNYEMGYSYLKELLIAGGSCPEEAYILNRPEPVLQIVTVEALMQQVGKPGILVIDSFRGAFRLAGDAENSAGGAGIILRNLQDVGVNHKWLIIVVHHSNRSQREGTDGVSGTSDWIAAPDVIWTWSRPDKNKPGVLHVEGRMPPVDPLAIDLGPDRCIFVGSVEESQRETDNKAIIEAVTEEGQSADVIAEMIGRPAGTVRKRCEALFEQKLVARDGDGKRGSPRLYSKVSFRTENLLGAETNPDGWDKVPR